MIHVGVNPVALTVGGLSVRWYGVAVTAAIVAIILWIRHFWGKMGVTSDFVAGVAVVAVPFGLLVSKLLHVIDKLSYYASHPGEMLNPAGLTIFGAILGGILGMWIYCRLRGVPAAPLLDLAAPGVILGQAIGRIGCTINGCCYGKPTTLPWGFVYTHPNSYAPLGIAVHPTQVYELLWDLLVFGLLFYILRGRLRPEGSLIAAYLALYSLGTFGIRFLRGDVTPFVLGLQEAQLVSLVILLAVLPFLLAKARWVSKNEQANSN